ncbi:MAG: bifunctional glycosyltransferase family 2/GtrA family protein [Patescibacteria group bacterium]|nr:bifunctional glycosyltransferase family 2/GtrA family protein [Patescibacteria group bacterium]MDE2172467.1 bifunctional glycosyltransferase family 2/GtrA family protein [Patescibacteria group bacterium]
MPHQLSEISVFFPAFNEEQNIDAVLREALRVVPGIAEKFEIIVVDDGSDDRTSAVVDRWHEYEPRIRLVRHSVNKGYGAALWSGIQTARYSWVFFSDADLQFDLEDLSKLVPYATDYQVILGYRAPRRDPAMRRFNALGWKILNRLFFGLKVRDIDCAFKLFARHLVADLPLETRGATMSAEMLIRLERQGVSFKEVPVRHLPRRKGNPTGAKPSVIIRALKEFYHLWRGELGRTDTAYVQGAKFGLVGVFNTVVDVATYYLLTRFMPFFPTHILVAKFATFFCGTICSFLLNRRFTFRVRQRLSLAEVAKFYSSIVVTVSVNVASLYVFNSLLGIYDLVAVGLSTIATFLIGFALSRLWVFRAGVKAPFERIAAPFKRSIDGFKTKLHNEQIDWEEIARVSNE